MIKGLDDLDKLFDILSAEESGNGVDNDEARRLAGRLAEEFPEISRTMKRIVDRMSDGPR